MEKMIKVTTPHVMYSGIFHFRHIYYFIKDFLMEEGYTDPFGSFEFIENFYREKRNAKGARYITFRWRSANNPGSDYFEYHLDIDCNIYNMVDIDIVKDNKKIQAQKGELQFFIEGKLEVEDTARHLDEKKHGIPLPEDPRRRTEAGSGAQAAAQPL